MLNIKDKINNVTTEEGFLTAKDTNSIINELKNAVSTYLQLDGNDNNQLAKAVDIASKSMYYKDNGSTNHVHLVRSSTQDQVESLTDGATVLFKPKNANTGDFKIKLNTQAEKDAVVGDGETKADFLQTDEIYMAIFDSVNDRFDVYQLSVKVTEYSTNKHVEDVRSALANSISDNVSSLNDKIKSVDDDAKNSISALSDKTDKAVDDLNDRIDDFVITADYGTL